MARFEKSRQKSAKPHAAVAAPRRGTTAPSVEDTMFFPRLRRHAKWMFVLLALIFGLGFVLFGVGAGGVGVGDVFRDAGGASGQSVSDAREKTEDTPKDPEAWIELSTALQTEGETAEAIAALDQAIALRPKDPDPYRQLASLHLTQATKRQQDAQVAQYVAAFRAPAQAFLLFTSPSGQAVVSDPIGLGINSQASQRATTAYQEAQTSATLAVDAYEQLAKLQPDDPNVQLELAQAAQQTGDAASAITAYQQFLKLAPDDPNAAIVREQLKQLRGTAAASSG
ncbi:MAG TPA: tetratricopeptide repeat protein [Gaiella sp.]